MVGTHSASVDDKKYGLFLGNLHIYAKWAELLGKGFQSVKKLRFAEDDANIDSKRTKLDDTLKLTSTDTLVVPSNDRHSSVPTGGTHIPSFGTAFDHGDLASVELAAGYGFGIDQDKGGMA